VKAREVVVTDACSLLNLIGTGQCAEIANAVAFRLLVVDRTAEEARYLVGRLDGDGNPSRKPIDLNPLIESSVLQLVAAKEVEAAHLVEAAARLTDVDALGVALAKQIGRPLLSDDGKVRKVFAALCPEQELYSSLQIIKRATKTLHYKEPAIRQILRAMRYAANFEPPRLDPDRDWFRHYLNDS
jgi:hypothetical protein